MAATWRIGVRQAGTEVAAPLNGSLCYSLGEVVPWIVLVTEEKRKVERLGYFSEVTLIPL